MLACTAPQASNHHDLFGIEAFFEQLCVLLEEAELSLSGLFLNADSGFDSQQLQLACQHRQLEANIALNCCCGLNSTSSLPYFDEELYKRCGVIEQANSWLDSFKTLLVRYETCAETWVSFHWLAFVVLFLRKIERRKAITDKS